MGQPLGFRMLLTLYTIISFLKNASPSERKEKVWFSKAVLLHCIISPHIPLRNRSQNYQKHSKLSDLVEKFSLFAIAPIIDTTVRKSFDDLKEEFSEDDQLLDFLDTRVLLAIKNHEDCFRDEESIGLPKLPVSIQTLWSAVDKDGEFFPVVYPVDREDRNRSYEEKSGPTAKRAYGFRTIPEAKALTKLECSLSKKITEDTDTMLEKAQLVTLEGATPRRSVFWKANDWSDGKLVSDQIKETKKMTTKWDFKQRQRYINFMDKYSKSLVGGKIVLRDVIIAKKESSTPNKKKQMHGHKKKKEKKNSKNKIDVRAQAAAEILKKFQ